MDDVERAAALTWAHHETRSRLEDLSKRVREGKDLRFAAEFASYVLWSGWIRFFEDEQAPKISGPEIQAAAEKLQADVREFYIFHKKEPEVALSEIVAINRKMDIVAGQLASNSAAIARLENELNAIRRGSTR